MENFSTEEISSKREDIAITEKIVNLLKHIFLKYLFQNHLSIKDNVWRASLCQL